VIERQRQHKQKVRDLARTIVYAKPSIEGTTIKETNEGIIDLKKVYGSMLRIATFIYFEFVSHHIDSNNKVVVEKLMGNNIVKPHLPYFYLPLVEAKVQHSLVQSLRNELQEVKGVHSKENLTYKCTLLHVVVKVKNLLVLGH
jgi:hypothetical protein